MDSELTRADKRRRKKKERKRKQRQLYAISTKTNSILSDPEKDSEESSGKEEDKVPVTIPAICEECSENKVQYHCLDCKHYYCSSVGSWIDYCSFQCYERIHKELIKEKRETHPNCIDLLEVKEKEKNTPIVSQMEVLARNIGFVPSRSDSHSPEEEKPICPQPKQHNGLRCKKCFELLVRDDEFLFASFWTVTQVCGWFAACKPHRFGETRMERAP